MGNEVTNRHLHQFKHNANHDLFKKPRVGLYSDTVSRWFLIWGIIIMFGFAINGQTIHYLPCAGMFLLAIFLGSCNNQIELNLLRKAYPKSDFKGIILSNLLTHYLISFIIMLISLIVTVGTSLLYYYQWTDNLCLILGGILMICIDWLILNLYRFAPYETMQHLSGTFKALRQSQKFVVNHWKSLLWLNLTFIGYDIGNFVTLGLVELYYHDYKTSTMIYYFKYFH